MLYSSSELSIAIDSSKGYPLSRFSTRRTEKKQLDWLATNTDDITSQSHSLFACSREQIRQVGNRLYSVTTGENQKAVIHNCHPVSSFERNKVRWFAKCLMKLIAIQDEKVKGKGAF